MARLGARGSSRVLRAELMPHGFAGEVMTLVAETWQTFSMHRSVRHEEPITALFATALEDAYVAQGRSWFVFLEGPVTDPTFGTQTGRNDLRFFHRNIPGQRNFFTVECKRLRVTTSGTLRHLSVEYVAEGLLRFVDGRYAAGLNCGAMLGYVLDNNVPQAFAGVQAAIETQRTALKMGAKLKIPSSILPTQYISAESRHKRSDGEFTAYHLLVGVLA